ncbi:hypothetical protein [Mycobacterium sp. E2479]|uniref:hypothetical protein n=1 Tax=Mycobacterium sp. E2479 TaxID=1834134 RepID=UPI0012EA2F76|nr:hypothetical protein [Mycobacterium sp. E2479]
MESTPNWISETDGEPNHPHFVSWRTFICRLADRFASASTDPIPPLRAGGGYRNFHELQTRKVRRKRGNREGIDFACTRAQFVDKIIVRCRVFHADSVPAHVLSWSATLVVQSSITATLFKQIR